jgi:polysaccharide biosynthesis transport protein
MDLNTQQEVHLTHYWNVIRKRWKVAAAIVGVVMIGTFLASYFSKPLYRSTIQLQIERETNAVTIEDIFGIAASDQEFLQTQYVLLKSRGLALRVVDDHKLYSDPQIYPPGVAGKTPGEINAIRESLAATLLGAVTVTPVRNTSLVEISYVGNSPRNAQKVADAWGDSYIQMNIAKKLATVQQASEFLTRQITTVQSDLESARRELTDYSKRAGIIAVGESSNNDSVALAQLTQLTTDVAAAQNNVFQRRADLSALQNTSADAVASTDQNVQRLSAELTNLERQYRERLATMKEAHPEMTALSSQISEMRTQRNNAVRGAYSKAVEEARARLSAAEAQERSVRGAYSSQRGETQRLNADTARYLDLSLAVQAKQGLLATLQKQFSETEVAMRLRGSTGSNVHWIDHAQAGVPFSVSMKKNMQTAAPLGLILAFGAVFFLEYMDRSIKTSEELERVTGFASLGVIPSAASMSGRGGYTYGSPGTPRLRAVDSDDGEEGIELIPHTDARSPIAEAYRAFRTSLLLASAASPKVIAITSSFAREGKTTTSVNLATVLAQMGKPVLIVDADLRRPRLQKVFPGKMNLGLVNYLVANIPLDDIIQATEVPNLSVALSGPIPPNPSELLASDRMRHFIEEMRGRYAYVIFDSPPVLAVTDAVVLAANADGVVLCVHGGHTPREHVQRSAERLRQANIPVLGAILNNLDLTQHGYGYRKSYYDYYASDDEPQERDRRSV